ncbi:reverse transcriptase domain-containing protein [Trichonephila clavipes]|uniref:Reverse transcriptase domain-containing protein n=1 Tax=Trichonephila clavipes TaxID=2585209 RepID=A0A8X6T0W7_TRICX|nr:reverse transcriptase domain-containing protein [Trichonephila clavipes]
MYSVSKVPGSEISSCNAMRVASLFVKEMDISQLWRLDSLGIQDPSEQKTKEELHKASMEHFLRTVKVGLQVTTHKLKKENLFKEYGDVFKEWKREGITEEVSKEELRSVSYYLPHRHVVKTDSTTKIRPVFNASSKQKGAVSLNDYLEKSLNLIELIPSISPFLLGSTIQYHLEKKLEAKQGRGKYPECIVQKLMSSFYRDNCLASVQTQSELDRFIDVATEIMAERKFDLRDFRELMEEVITKRNILAASHKVFDSLRITGPRLPFQRLYPLEVSAKTEIGVLKAPGKDSLPVEKTPESSTDHVSDSLTDYVSDSPVKKFDKADAALPIESSEMGEFETKYYETKAKLQNILENLYVRTYVYNDNSDVFENVSIADEDQKYQQILWKNNSNENIRTYKLKAVTYGLAPASFLATRCIKQIALDNIDNPNLSRVLQEDINIDDLLLGSNTPNNAISICKDIAHVLSTRGFHLKWNSNSTEFFAQFSEHCSHDTRVEFSP